MMSDELTKDLEAFEATPEGVAMDLRLDFADIVMRRLDELGVSNAEFAKRANVSEVTVEGIINADVTLTMDEMGRVLHALGVKAGIVEA